MRIRRKRFLTVTIIGLLASAVLVGASSAPAADGPFTMQGDQFEGTSGNDVLVITRDGDFFSHNRFAAGDPGFASARDFDTSQAGTQEKRVGSYSVRVAFGDGDDTLKIVGFATIPVDQAYMGAGTDTIDFSGMTAGVTTGSSWQSHSQLERVIGTPFADNLHAYRGMPPYPTDPAMTIIGLGGDDSINGGPGDDVLDGGPGANRIDDALGGNDTLVVDLPLPGTAQSLDGGTGSDTIRVRGTDANDGMALMDEVYAGIRPLDGSPGGYSTREIERVEVDLGGGDDDLYVEPVGSTSLIDGGAGSDAMTVNAKGASVQRTPGRIAVADRGELQHEAVESIDFIGEFSLATTPQRGGGPHVRLFGADGAAGPQFLAYDPAFTGGLSVALGDLDGDGVYEVVTGAGPGGGPHVRVFNADGSDFAGGGFFAYDIAFTGGVNVATGDLDGDGLDEIITAPARDGGPHVRVFDEVGNVLIEFMADGFGNTGLDLDTGIRYDGADKIVLGAAAGDTPLVGAFYADGEPYIDPFLAFDPGFRGGVSIAVGEMDRSDYRDEIVVGAGPGGGPHVKVFGPSLQYGGEHRELGSFLAFDPAFRGGVDVGAGDIDGGFDEVVVAAGPGGGPHVRMFASGGSPKGLSFFAYAPAFGGGVHIATTR